MQEFKGKIDMHALIDRPVDVAALAGELTPPEHFAKATFDTYIPELSYPSQSVARTAVQSFVHSLAGSGSWQWFRKKPSGKGLYLDGGFGVGKTHLLVAA